MQVKIFILLFLIFFNRKMGITRRIVDISLKGLSGLVLSLALAGCSSSVPIIDCHTKTGEPVKGLLPLVLSNGEAHHIYQGSRPDEYSPQINFICYPF